MDFNAYFRQVIKLVKLTGGQMFFWAKHTKRKEKTQQAVQG